MSADALCDFVQRLFLIPEITRIVGGVDELWGTVLVRFKASLSHASISPLRYFVEVRR